MADHEPEEERASAGPVPPGNSFVVLEGFYEGLEIPVDRDWLVIGRGRGADVMLAEPTISRAHCALGYEAGRFFVQDLGSTNGTWINGSREKRASLKHLDEIQMGKLRLRVELAPCTAAAGAPGAADPGAAR
jgi:pSer/pThr/pTyr-binding forkhead associated (FHA) protein